MRLKQYSDQNDRSIHDVSNYKKCGINIRYFYLTRRRLRRLLITERRHRPMVIEFNENQYKESIFSVSKPGKALRLRNKYGRFNK